ncbi:hypothetical protein [Amycolatopsis cihanbeyliensis]
MNAWLWETTGRRYQLDAHYLAKLERGVVRRPGAPYRAGLRHVLGAVHDADLGFTPPGRAETGARVTDAAASRAPASWEFGGLIERVTAMTEHDLMPPNRRTFLTGTGMLAGAALTAELRPLLWPVAPAVGSRVGQPFTSPELDAVAHLVHALRSWHSSTGALSRPAVVAQLGVHTRRLGEAPQNTPETLRAFRLGAELAEIAASMAWDAAEHVQAQRYYVIAVQLAHAAGDNALTAIALAALARQCYDLERPVDGLEMV